MNTKQLERYIAKLEEEIRFTCERSRREAEEDQAAMQAMLHRECITPRRITGLMIA